MLPLPASSLSLSRFSPFLILYYCDVLNGISYQFRQSPSTVRVATRNNGGCYNRFLQRQVVDDDNDDVGNTHFHGRTFSPSSSSRQIERFSAKCARARAKIYSFQPRNGKFAGPGSFGSCEARQGEAWRRHRVSRYHGSLFKETRRRRVRERERESRCVAGAECSLYPLVLRHEDLP